MGASKISCISLVNELEVINERCWGSAHPITLLVQLLPYVLFQPLFRILGWTLFIHLFMWGVRDWGLTRLVALILAIAVTNLAVGIVMPLFAISIKWLVIGRYREGQYRLFGTTYLKRSFVTAMLRLTGRGVFKDYLPVYYRMLGASIGPGVKISEDAQITEPDLLTIGASVALDSCIVRPFVMNPNGCFMLCPINIGECSCVCAKSVVAGSASLPPWTCMGPLSSNHELKDARPENRAACRILRASPPFWLRFLCGTPILFAQKLLFYTPVFLLLEQMVSQAWHTDRMGTIGDVLDYFATPQRMGYYLAMLVVKKVVSPFLALFCAIAVKHCIIGTFCATPPGQQPDTSAWELFRPWLLSKLIPDAFLCGVTKVLGRHYEAVSALYRLLGVKVGKRVYWPGSGFRFVEPDLVEVGDYVVFGSRSLLITSDAGHRRQPIRIEGGSNVSDRCVLLPGTVVKSGAVLGSGVLTKQGMTYAAGTYVGSRGNGPVLLKKAQNQSTKEVPKSAYARAFMERSQMPYFVLPEVAHVLWSFFAIAVAAILARAPIVIAQQLGKLAFGGDFIGVERLEVLVVLGAFLICGFTVVLIIALAIDIGSKWLFMGRRQPGSYAWDESSYNQRWQLYLSLAPIRFCTYHGQDVLDFFRGSQLLVWYFKALGAHIGKDVCLYPNGADPMMTEPDLVTIGNMACIDDASLICHLNTQGVFSINKLTVGDNCVMRSFSRMQQSAVMEPGSVLLEHTLVYPADTVKANEWRQGWPSAKRTVRERSEASKAVLEGRRAALKRKMASIRQRVLGRRRI